MNRNTGENREAQSIVHGKACTYTDTIKKRVYKDGYPSYSHNVIIVLMGVLMAMIVVMVIVRVGSEYFLEEIDSEEAYYKRINSVTTFL